MCWIWKSVSSFTFCCWKSNFRFFQAIQEWGGEKPSSLSSNKQQSLFHHAFGWMMGSHFSTQCTWNPLSFRVLCHVMSSLIDVPISFRVKGPLFESIKNYLGGQNPLKHWNWFGFPWEVVYMIFTSTLHRAVGCFSRWNSQRFLWKKDFSPAVWPAHLDQRGERELWSWCSWLRKMFKKNKSTAMSMVFFVGTKSWYCICWYLVCLSD